ncbi:MAG: penicillin acylase family protein, partial [Pseudomonadota bacterium]
MTQVFLWLVRIFGGLILLGLAAGLGVYFLLSRSLPDYSKELEVAGISAPIEIVRDNANVPHIFGETDEDTFFGLGYAHAQDRLWQMVIFRRTVQGRLSEVFGTPTVEIDQLMRRYDLYRLARQSVEVQDEDTRAALSAYAAGVNARLREINERALGRGAPEFFAFGFPIAPWQPADSIAVIKLMSVQLATHLDEEVVYARASIALEDEA